MAIKVYIIYENGGRGGGWWGCFKKFGMEGQKAKQRTLTFQEDNGMCVWGPLLVLFSCLSHGARSQFMANHKQLIQT